MPGKAEALTSVQRNTILAALAPFAGVIERVDVFGSRARGDHRPGSDVDLLIHGQADDIMLERIRSALDESDLSIWADIHFAPIIDDKLGREVLREAKVLFTQADLLSPRSRSDA